MPSGCARSTSTPLCAWAIVRGCSPRASPTAAARSLRACFSDADVIVDDVARYLLPLRHHVPRAAWVSIAMHPIGDELFMDWPLMAQMDAIIWAYPPAVGLPDELGIVADKVVQTGPFLDLEDVPDKATARAKLGFATNEVVVYAPRGFPFGEEFGRRVLAAVYGAVAALRRSRYPKLRLVLLAINDPAELHGVSRVPAELPHWVTILGVPSPGGGARLRAGCAHTDRGGDQHDPRGAALRTPLVLVPGPIEEIRRLANAMDDRDAATVCAISSRRKPWPTPSERS